MSTAYTPLASEAAYRQAFDTILGLAKHEVLIFDRDLRALRLEDKARLDVLIGFLQTKGSGTIRLVLHEPGHLERHAPLLTQLFARCSPRVALRQCPENLRHLADTHVLVDRRHGVRRFHADQPRGALILDDEDYIDPWWQRFEELWELAVPCSSLTGAGL